MTISRRTAGYSENKFLIGLGRGMGWTQARTSEWAECSVSTVEKWWNDDWVRWLADKVKGAVAADQADFTAKTRAELEGELKKRYDKVLKTIDRGFEHEEWGANQWAAGAVLDRVVPKTQRTEQEWRGQLTHTYELPEFFVKGMIEDVKQIEGISDPSVLEAEVIEQTSSS